MVVQFTDFGVLSGENTVASGHSSIGCNHTVIRTGNRDTSSAHFIDAYQRGNIRHWEIDTFMERKGDNLGHNEDTLHCCRRETSLLVPSAWLWWSDFRSKSLRLREYVRCERKMKYAPFLDVNRNLFFFLSICVLWLFSFLSRKRKNQLFIYFYRNLHKVLIFYINLRFNFNIYFLKKKSWLSNFII